VELYLYSPSGPSGSVIGQTSLYYITPCWLNDSVIIDVAILGGIFFLVIKLNWEKLVFVKCLLDGQGSI
jgi:hypothetical protein